MAIKGGARIGLIAAVLALAALLGAIGFRTARADHADALPAIRTSGPAIDAGIAATHLAQAIRFPTITPEGGRAPAEGLARLRAWLRTTYPSFHAAARQLIQPDGTLIYHWRGSDPRLAPIVLMAHQDVVPADHPETWGAPPFAGRIVGGTIVGRGAVDDKGSLIAIMEAAESLAARRQTPRRGIILLFGSDEEGGGGGAHAAADLLRRAGVRPWFVLDEGSIAVADHPVTGRPVALIGISEKGYATLRITAAGAGGHSSAPPDDNAVAVLARAIVAVTQSPFPRRYSGATRQMLEALAPEAPLATRVAIANPWLFGPLLRATIGATPQGAAMLHTTIAPTMMQGSPKANVLAASASATINVRIDPSQSTADVLTHVQRAVKGLPVSVKIVGTAQEPSPVSPTQGEAYRFLAGVTRGALSIPVVPAPVIAQTDSRFLRTLTPAIYRFEPLTMRIADTAMLHGRNERIGIQDLARMIRFYQTLMVGSP